MQKVLVVKVGVDEEAQDFQSARIPVVGDCLCFEFKTWRVVQVDLIMDAIPERDCVAMAFVKPLPLNEDMNSA